MAVFSKPIDFPFYVSESKSKEFFNKDTRPSFHRGMERFQIHGGKAPVVKYCAGISLE